MSTTQSVLNAPSIGQHNQGVMDSLSRAKRMAIILARHGFTVLNVISTNRNARIVIKQPVSNAPITHDAAAIKYTPYDTTYAVNIEGVQVEWVIGRMP